MDVSLTRFLENFFKLILIFTKFSYDSNNLHVSHLRDNGRFFIEKAIDMTNYAQSIEWDVLSVSATLNNKPKNVSNDEFYEGIVIYLNLNLNLL